MNKTAAESRELTFDQFREQVLDDYRIAYESRQASLLGRKEVLTGKAKFGIFGDGKEVAQLAMARAFKKGDFRSGYYRDQTFMFAKGMSTLQEFFAQLYAHTDVEAEPASAGRSMNGHFGTRLLDEKGQWRKQTNLYNSSADISPTAGQMPRLLGLALASKLYRENKDLHQFTDFSDKGNEVAFGTIGNASSSEGGFWEAFNAAGVLQVPMAISVWDDGYGISVPARYQTTKENISEILKGFQRDENNAGYEIFTVNGWDYPELCKVYEKAIDICRNEHVPVLIHVRELTQPQGHSTSGSHERYKSKDRLTWETEYDCIVQMRKWMVENSISNDEELDALEEHARKAVQDARKAAWDASLAPVKNEIEKVCQHLGRISQESSNNAELEKLVNELKGLTEPIRKDIGVAVHKALKLTLKENLSSRDSLIEYYREFKEDNRQRYGSALHSESSDSAMMVPEVKPVFTEDSKSLDGREILNACFDAALGRDPRVFAFGEDVGNIGDVNQGFAGLQAKYGELRVTDKGIRELTIIGEAIGTAMRGLRPIAEIQYLDYLLYAIQIMSDDIATLQWRTKGGQKAPLIIRTRGHRLEGIWHSGSPMGMIIHAVRGMHVLVPRNMTQAAGFYNTLLRSDEPALVIECLNGYRLKEKLPENIGEFTVPLGVPEVIREGDDITLVTYGSCCRIALDAATQLQEFGISVEIVDVQTLLPFDINNKILESVKKTSQLVFLDEDVPGGATAYMLQQVLEKQGAYRWLDSEPKTIAAQPHRPAYGTDGDYFSKPSVEDVFTVLYEMMHDYAPGMYPKLL